MFHFLKTKKANLLYLLFCTTFFFACAKDTTKITRDNLYLQSPTPDDCSINSDINWTTLADTLDTNAHFDSFKEVAAYICKAGHLPHNYVKKDSSRKLCEEKRGSKCPKFNYNPEEFLGIMVGGDTFYNRDAALPVLPADQHYTESDVDYPDEKNRGPNRLIFRITPETCFVYYTQDHYKPGSFCRLNPTKMY